MDKVRALGLDKNTLVFFTTDNGAWQDVYPDAGYTPFRGTKGTVREGGSRVPAIAWMPGKIKAGVKNFDILGGLDFMATFASIATVKLPDKDRAKASPSSSTATICRRFCSVPVSRPDLVVLFYGERVDARCRACRQL